MKCPLKSFLLVTLASLVPTPCRSFPEEAPPETCYMQAPNHPATKSQPLSTFPYEFVADAGGYKKKGDTINGEFILKLINTTYRKTDKNL